MNDNSTQPDDITIIEELKKESLTALSLYNHIVHFYLEEGDKGLDYLQKMWEIAKDECIRLKQK
jgi:hypothetical protein